MGKTWEEDRYTSFPKLKKVASKLYSINKNKTSVLCKAIQNRNIKKVSLKKENILRKKR